MRHGKSEDGVGCGLIVVLLAFMVLLSFAYQQCDDGLDSGSAPPAGHAPGGSKSE